MVRADIITSVILMVLGAATVEESWRMPRYTDVGGSVWSAPGVVPGLLGVALALMAFILFVRSVSARKAGAVVDEDAQVGGWKRVAVATGLCIVYGALLVGHLPFWLATFAFVFVFIVVFELVQADARMHWLRHVILALFIAAVTAAAVSYVFQSVFFVRLP